MIFAGMMPVNQLPRRETGTNEGSITPAKSFLHNSNRFAIRELPRRCEIEPILKKFAIFIHPGRALSREGDPESGQHVQDAARSERPKLAFQPKLENSAE